MSNVTLGFELDLDVAANASKGGRITTGIYKVTITKAFVSKTANGNNIVDLELKSENGEVGFINGLCIDKNWVSGAENFDYPRWQELAASVGMRSLTTSPMKRITKDGEVNGLVINELMNKTLQVAVYEEYDVYNDKEKVTLKLANSFLADGRSVAEAQAKKPASRIEKISSRLQSFETKAYKDWKAHGGGTTPTQTQPTQATQPVMAEEEEDDIFG